MSLLKNKKLNHPFAKSNLNTCNFSLLEHYHVPVTGSHCSSTFKFQQSLHSTHCVLLLQGGFSAILKQIPLPRAQASPLCLAAPSREAGLGATAPIRQSCLRCDGAGVFAGRRLVPDGQDGEAGELLVSRAKK